MPPPTRTDPLPSSNFRVEIDGIGAFDFLEVTGIEASVAIIDYREGGDPASAPQKLPGEARFTTLTLKRGLTADLSLWNWMRQTLEGNVSRRNISIVLLNAGNEDVMRFNFINAWPAKWEGPALKGDANEIAIETLEIAHEGLELVV
jgi:phage tail-like protein